MRLTRLVLWLGLVVGLAITPASALADHCGASATVIPSTGPPGTMFVFKTNLGAPSDLHLYRDGRLVRSVFLRDDGFVTYAIETRAGDSGAWRARAEVRGQTNCAAQARFTVAATPDTSTEAAPPHAGPPWVLLLLAGAVASVAAFRRSGRSLGVD